MTQQDVEESTSAPVAAVLSQHKKKETIVVKKDSRTVVSEMFRLLRANLSYIMPEKDLKSLLITSSLSGEGKSFISINLAMTMALSNKRVIIIELDLRKPKQEAYLGIKDSDRRAGVVDYLVDTRLNYKEIIRNSGLHRNLDFIASGPKPPNPSELTLSPRLRDLMAKVSAEYDFIILDAPPVGLVADALQIKDMADATMYVVRSGVTRKPHLQIIQDIVENKKLPRPFVVLNGVQRNGVGPYGYGYGSSKGYLED
jgi:capsular exopolysaccharide synthesis family protein